MKGQVGEGGGVEVGGGQGGGGGARERGGGAGGGASRTFVEWSVEEVSTLIKSCG